MYKFLIILLISLYESNGKNVKIIGGYPINITDIPYQVSLDMEGYQWCGGSIISDIYIVTAAHCVSGLQVSSLKVRAGITLRSENAGQTIQVESIIVHPQNRFDYDIAVLKLSSKLEFNDAVQAIKIMPFEIITEDIGLVSGWGLTYEGGQTTDELRATKVMIISTEDCMQYYPGYITPRMICAGIPETGGHDACQGDSGGPLVYQGYLVGVVSFGEGCGRPGKPGVYAKISELRDFIRDVTGIQ